MSLTMICTQQIQLRSHIKFLRIYLYRISSVIQLSFFSFQNNPKNLGPSYKRKLDFCDSLGRLKLVL